MVRAIDHSHVVRALPGFLFCDVCGAYSSSCVRLLGSRCEGEASAGRAHWLGKLRSGLDPRTCEYLGDVSGRLNMTALEEYFTAAAWLRPG